jgi:hypothetical protein
VRTTPINDNTTATTRDVLTDDVVLQDHNTSHHEAVPQLMETKVDLSQPFVTSRSEGLESILQREYLVSDVAWAYSDVGNTNIASLSFPSLLFALAPLWDRIKMFTFFKADLRLRFRVNSTPYHYGSVLIAANPVPAFSSAWDNHIAQMSGSQSILLSANNQTPVEMTIPFASPTEFINVDSTSANLATVVIRVLNALKIAGSGTNPSISISVFASFVNIKLQGPSTIVATSSGKTNHKKVSPTQETKIKQGFIGKTAKVVGDIAGGLTKVPIIGGIASAVAPIADLVGGVADFFGWDKPPVLKPSRPVYDASDADWYTARSAVSATVLGPDPDYRLSTDPKVFHVDDPACRSLQALLQSPMLCSTFSITSAQAASTVFKTIQVKPFSYMLSGLSDCYPDYMGHYAQFYDSWRGSIKYLIYVATSSYTSARLRITYQPNLEAVASVPNGGEAPSMIVEIQGDTVIEFTVPYVQQAAYQPVDRHTSDAAVVYSNGALHFSLVNSTRTSGSTDTIYFNVFRAAGEDFEFNDPVVKITPNCDYAVNFKKQFPSIVPDSQDVALDNLLKPNKFAGVTDYVKVRPSDPTQSNSAVTTTFDFLSTNFTNYLAPFRFWRGGLIFYVSPYAAPSLTIQHDSGNSQLLKHYEATSSLPTQSAVVVPFSCNYRYRIIGSSLTGGKHRIAYYNASSSNVALSVGAADDFQVGGRIGPPSFQLPS